LEELKKHEEVVVFHKENGGLSSARNYGASHSKGEYLLFLDNDDSLEPDTVLLLLLKLFQTPESSFAYPYQVHLFPFFVTKSRNKGILSF
jgi:glycosyltransferase involved in cell wall biosynthesis